MNTPPASTTFPSAPARAAIGASSLWAALSITWLASVGTSIGWAGVFFIAEQAYGFDRRENLTLGAVMGVVYVAGALLAGRTVGALVRRTRLSERGALLGVNLLLAGSAAVPASTASTAGLWVFASSYIALSGVLWPVVESFVSGGRSGGRLRKATGLFNIAWSSAMIVTMFGIAPTLEDTPRAAFWGLAAVHVVVAALALRLKPFAGRHGDASHEHAPAEVERYRTLLRGFRVGLFASYVLHASLVPMLPSMLERLGVDVSFKTVLASAWMIARFAAFVIMERFDWWHGRVRTLVIASGLMIVGFVWTHLVGALAVPGGSAGMVASLAVLGLGIGAMYAGAIYYAMETGGADTRDDAHIEAGGVHEAMIGLGYTLGPVIALLVLWE